MVSIWSELHAPPVVESPIWKSSDVVRCTVALCGITTAVTGLEQKLKRYRSSRSALEANILTSVQLNKAKGVLSDAERPYGRKKKIIQSKGNHSGSHQGHISRCSTRCKVDPEMQLDYRW